MSAEGQIASSVGVWASKVVGAAGRVRASLARRCAIDPAALVGETPHRETYLQALNAILDGRVRRWLEGQRQKLDPWGGWMHSDFLEDAAYHPERWRGRTETAESRQRLTSYEGANLVHSEVSPETWTFVEGADSPSTSHPFTSVLASESKHILALDIDFPGRWVPSSTPGKGHLYINRPMPWSSVEKVLKTLAEVGILHRNYVKHTTERGYTCLRPAFVQKPKAFSDRFSSDFDPLEPDIVSQEETE